MVDVMFMFLVMEMLIYASAVAAGSFLSSTLPCFSFLPFYLGKRSQQLSGLVLAWFLMFLYLVPFFGPFFYGGGFWIPYLSSVLVHLFPFSLPTHSDLFPVCGVDPIPSHHVPSRLVSVLCYYSSFLSHFFFSFFIFFLFYYTLFELPRGSTTIITVVVVRGYCAMWSSCMAISICLLIWLVIVLSSAMTSRR